MRILQITAYYPPSVGGIQYYVQSLSRSLARRGHDVDVVTVNTEQAELVETTAEGIDVRRCKLNLSFYRAVISTEFIKYLMAAKSYDVYHIHIPFHLGLEAAVIAAQQNKTPLVATHHGQGIRGSWIYMAIAGTYSWFSRAISLRGVDSLVFLTESYRRSLWLPRAIQERVKIVRTGAEIRSFSPNGSELDLRQQYELPGDAPLILFVGSLHKANRYKGVDYLIRALPIVRNVVKDARLLIAGGGELLTELKVLAQQMHLEDAVIFAGSVDNALLPGYYAAADVLALPSITGPENSPIVVFEAMASAKPVIASNLPGVCEVVQSGKTGLLVEPKDIEGLAMALIRVLTDKTFRLEAGRNARALAESYSWDHCTQEMETIYRELI